MTAAPLPDGALSAAEVAGLIGRGVAWVEAHLGEGGYPTMQRSSDGKRWVDQGQLEVWRELSERERALP